MTDEIKLTREEQESHVNFTAQERIDGIMEVFTDDPTMITRLAKIRGFEDISDSRGIKPPARLFRSQNHDVSISFRPKSRVPKKQREAAAERLAAYHEEQKQVKGEQNG